jgi:hypothetical protein
MAMKGGRGVGLIMTYGFVDYRLPFTTTDISIFPVRCFIGAKDMARAGVLELDFGSICRDGLWKNIYSSILYSAHDFRIYLCSNILYLSLLQGCFKI